MVHGQRGQVLNRRRAAVLGSPIAHSLSPVLHRAAYAALGLDWSYDAIEIDAPHLPGFLAGLGEEWVGLSLTMPLKEAVLPHLAAISDIARLTGAANTVLLAAAGARGDNTDVFGIVAAAGGPGPKFPRASIIGAGATARSAAAAAVELGARHVTVVARRPEAAAATAAVAAARGAKCDVVAWSEAAGALRADLVISTVPGDAGASLADPLPARCGVLLDVTYAPWPTTLAAAWPGRVVPGVQMLLWQAARQVELMTGMAPPVQAMRAALPAALNQA